MHLKLITVLSQWMYFSKVHRTEVINVKYTPDEENVAN